MIVWYHGQGTLFRRDLLQASNTVTRQSQSFPVRAMRRSRESVAAGTQTLQDETLLRWYSIDRVAPTHSEVTAGAERTSHIGS